MTMTVIFNPSPLDTTNEQEVAILTRLAYLDDVRKKYRKTFPGATKDEIEEYIYGFKLIHPHRYDLFNKGELERMGVMK